jgi:hypothetical protein
MTHESVSPPDLATEPTAIRNFGVSDAMFLIAGIALAISGGSKLVGALAGQGIALCRTIVAYNSAFYVARPQVWRDEIEMRWSTVLWYGFRVLEVLVFSLTPPFLLVRLRRPRPSFRAMIRQPGTVAGLAVTFGYFWVRGWVDRFFPGRINFDCVTGMAVGTTVAVTWALLALSRQWKTEPSWVERMGKLIGITAIAAGLLAFYKAGFLRI